MSITDINCPQWRKLNSYNNSCKKKPRKSLSKGQSSYTKISSSPKLIKFETLKYDDLPNQCQGTHPMHIIHIQKRTLLKKLKRQRPSSMFFLPLTLCMLQLIPICGVLFEESGGCSSGLQFPLLKLE